MRFHVDVSVAFCYSHVFARTADLPYCPLGISPGQGDLAILPYSFRFAYDRPPSRAKAAWLPGYFLGTKINPSCERDNPS